ncbi:MAG: glycosyltransferase family 9 protein [Verrucomicrobiota bacterium]
MSSPRGKILVIRGGAIGDFILTLPAIAALRKQFPEAHLEVLGYPHIAQLAQAGGLAARVQPIEARALAGFFARNGELEENLADYFSEFDIIVSYLFDPDLIFETNVRRRSPAQFIAGPHRPDEEESLHATKVYLKPLERLAIFDADNRPRLTFNAQPPTLNHLALHPGSGSETKNWPEAHWAELLRRLVETTPLHFLLVGGEAEGTRLEKLCGGVPAARCQVAKSLPLPELAARLQTCAAFIGHDSGITHLAAAVGLPALVLWSHTNETIWRPQGERITILRGTSGLSSLSPERVQTELAKLLAG